MLGGMPHRMLIVDDEESITFAVGRYFTRLGFEVESARTLGQAQGLLRRVKYDIVLVDLRLSDAHRNEGFDVLSLVRESSPGTRMVLLTAYASPQVQSEAFDLGADAVLRKPQTLMALADVVSRLLRV
jgi:DNA-binding response OmpR family regulator